MVMVFPVLVIYNYMNQLKEISSDQIRMDYCTAVSVMKASK